MIEDELEFYSFGPSDNYIRRRIGEDRIDSVARVLDGMEPDAREIVRRYNAHEDLVEATRALKQAYESEKDSVDWEDLNRAYDNAKEAFTSHNLE
jgi:hypothetical protein